MMRCPHCNCRDIGKIGTNQYYCWGCYLEFSMIGEEIKLYQVEEDGSLIAFEADSYPVEEQTSAM
jgi:hypothetical protein